MTLDEILKDFDGDQLAVASAYLEGLAAGYRSRIIEIENDPTRTTPSKEETTPARVRED